MRAKETKLKNTYERVNAVKDENTLSKWRKRLKKVLLTTFVAGALATSLVSCNAEVNPELSPSVLPPTQEQVQEQHNGNYTLTIGNISEDDIQDLMSKLPSDYKSCATNWGNKVIIRNVEEYDFISMVNDMNYENATYSLQGKKFKAEAMNLPLEDINNYIKNADLRVGEAELFVYDFDNDPNVDGYSFSVSVYDEYDLKIVKSILGDKVTYTDNLHNFVNNGEKDEILSFYNKGMNSLVVRDSSTYRNDPTYYLDVQDGVALDLIKTSGDQVIYEKAQDLELGM